MNYNPRLKIKFKIDFPPCKLQHSLINIFMLEEARQTIGKAKKSATNTQLKKEGLSCINFPPMFFDLKKEAIPEKLNIYH